MYQHSFQRLLNALCLNNLVKQKKIRILNSDKVCKLMIQCRYLLYDNTVFNSFFRVCKLADKYNYGRKTSNLHKCLSCYRIAM